MYRPHDSVHALLSRLGRSSTPAVKESTFGISLGKLVGLHASPESPEKLLAVAPCEAVKQLQSQVSVIFGSPGLLREQASSGQISYMVIDCTAFDSGPWLGADNGGNTHLAEEIFDAGRQIRARGGVVFIVTPPARIGGPDFARIFSTSTVDILDVPEEDLEEDAPQSALWQAVQQLATTRLEEEQ